MKKAKRTLLPEYGSLALGPVPQLKLHSLLRVCLPHITTLGKQQRRVQINWQKIEVAIPKLFNQLASPGML